MQGVLPKASDDASEEEERDVIADDAPGGAVDRRSTRSGAARRRVEHKGSSGDEENPTSTAGLRPPQQRARTGPPCKRHKDTNTLEFGHQVQQVDDGGQRTNSRRKEGNLNADEEHHRIEAAGAETREVQALYEEKAHQRLLAAARLEAAAVETKEARKIQREESREKNDLVKMMVVHA